MSKSYLIEYKTSHKKEEMIGFDSNAEYSVTDVTEKAKLERKTREF